MKTIGIFITIVAGKIAMMNAQFGMPSDDEAVYTAVKADLPYIGCDTCHRVMEELSIQFRKATDAKEDGKPLTEEETYEITEQICNPKTKIGRWINGIDIVESKSYNGDLSKVYGDISDVKKDGNNNYLMFLEQEEGYGKCQEECFTIAKSCNDLLDNELDFDDINVAVWKADSLEVLQKKFCDKKNKRCNKTTHKKMKKNYKDNRIDYVLTPKSEQDFEMDEMMEMMKAQGMNPNMMSRDAMADAYGGMGDDPYAGMGGMDDMMNMGDMDMGGFNPDAAGYNTEF